MERETKLLRRHVDQNGHFLSETWLDNSEQKGNLIWEEGFTIDRDYLKTNKRWFRLVELPSGEVHSGPFDDLREVFEGKKTLKKFYESFEIR